MIRVLIVDDSAVAREILKRGLSHCKGIEVVGTASDAYSARDKIVTLKPDVITLDVEMPRMNGIEFLKKLMPQYPLPVIIVSSLARTNAQLTLEALEAGAVDYILKPSSLYNLKPEEMISELEEKIRIAVDVDLSSWKRRKYRNSVRKRRVLRKREEDDVVIAIGASTGGTEALRRIITELPGDIPGVVVVQHMPPVFTRMFADNLNGKAAVTVKEAEDGDLILKGQVLIAPGGIHTEVVGTVGNCQIILKDYDKVSGHKPSVDVLFGSVAEHCCPGAIGIQLTGMGRDGVRGLLQMRENGARTLAQDEATSVVFGMPKEAFFSGAAEKLVPLGNIVDEICGLLEAME